MRHIWYAHIMECGWVIFRGIICGLRMRPLYRSSGSRGLLLEGKRRWALMKYSWMIKGVKKAEARYGPAWLKWVHVQRWLQCSDAGVSGVLWADKAAGTILCGSQLVGEVWRRGGKTEAAVATTLPLSNDSSTTLRSLTSTIGNHQPKPLPRNRTEWFGRHLVSLYFIAG